MATHEVPGRSSSSGSMGWLGSYARSVSGTMLYTTQPSKADTGLELVHMGIPAHDSMQKNSTEGASSPSVVAPGATSCSTANAAAPSATLLDTPSRASCKPPPPAARLAVPALAIPQSRPAATDSSVVSRHAQDTLGPCGHVAMNAAQSAAADEYVHASPLSAGASAGRFPDALGTPCEPHVSWKSGRKSQAMQQKQQQEQQHQQHPPTASSQPMQQSETQHKVRWLPGLKFDTAGTSSAGSDRQSEISPGTVGELSTQCNGPSGSSNSRQEFTDGNLATATTCMQPSAAEAASKRIAQLPPSGSQQLDKYLRYLLGEAHPHSFMYYPSWGMTENGCAAVGEFLRHDRRIKVMTLADNSIRDEGCELIAEGIAANKMLTCLDLSDNKISDMGAIALAESLHSNNTLKELKLTNNRIGDEGAEALAAVFAANSVLKKLHLAGNPLTAAQKKIVDHVLKTRVYKMPSKQAINKQSWLHLRKNSSLQFHIELTDCDDVLKSSARHRLPPATAVAALSEPADTLEFSLATQVAHLMAELRAATDRHPAQHTSSNASGLRSPSTTQPATPSSTAADSGSDDTELVPLLALRLAWRGYEVAIRTSVPCSHDGNLGGMVAGPDGKAAGLKHTFLLCLQPGIASDLSPAVVIDPHFKDQFKIPHMTDRYRGVLEALPNVLVLAESRLYHLVEALSSEIAQAYQDSGLSCPPWRDVQVLLDQWLCKNPVDLAVDSDATLESLGSAMASKG